jgi:hypothetical protein
MVSNGALERIPGESGASCIAGYHISGEKKYTMLAGGGV